MKKKRKKTVVPFAAAHLKENRNQTLKRPHFQKLMHIILKLKQTVSNSKSDLFLSFILDHRFQFSYKYK